MASIIIGETTGEPVPRGLKTFLIARQEDGDFSNGRKGLEPLGEVADKRGRLGRGGLESIDISVALS